MCCCKFRVHGITRLINSALRIHSLFVLHDWLGLKLEFVLVANNGFSTVHLVREIVSLNTHVWCVFLVPQSWVITVWPIYCPCRLHRRWYFSSNFLLLVLNHSWYSCALLLLRFAIVIALVSETIFYWYNMIWRFVDNWTTLKFRGFRVHHGRDCILFWIVSGWKLFFFWLSIFLRNTTERLITVLSWLK